MFPEVEDLEPGLFEIAVDPVAPFGAVIPVCDGDLLCADLAERTDEAVTGHVEFRLRLLADLGDDVFDLVRGRSGAMDPVRARLSDHGA
jgi:hypothetical protein